MADFRSMAFVLKEPIDQLRNLMDTVRQVYHAVEFLHEEWIGRCVAKGDKLRLLGEMG